MKSDEMSKSERRQSDSSSWLSKLHPSRANRTGDVSQSRVIDRRDAFGAASHRAWRHELVLWPYFSFNRFHLNMRNTSSKYLNSPLKQSPQSGDFKSSLSADKENSSSAQLAAHRDRTRIGEVQLTTLKKAFQIRSYPSREQRLSLAAETGLWVYIFEPLLRRDIFSQQRLQRLQSYYHLVPKSKTECEKECFGT